MDKEPKSRTPYKHIRLALRREVNFGCPAPRCGSPYLTYHHFDPPWSEKPHHNPAGLIALCEPHHSEAEGGALTTEVLRRMKREPFLAGRTVTARFGGWDRRALCLFAGGNWYINPPYVLRVAGHVVIGLTPPMGDEPGGIDLDVRDREGRPVLSMEANDWNLDVIPDNLECTPRRNNLQVVHARSGVQLAIRFRSLTRERLDPFLKRYCPMVAPGDLLQSLQDSTWPIAVATLSGYVPWPRPVILKEYETLVNRWRIGGNIIDHTEGFNV